MGVMKKENPTEKSWGFPLGGELEGPTRGEKHGRCLGNLPARTEIARPENDKRRGDEKEGTLLWGGAVLTKGGYNLERGKKPRT